MKLVKNAILAGVAVSTIGVVASAAPAHAIELKDMKELPSVTQLLDKNKTLKLNSESNGAVEVKTELNCSDHTVVAQVKNVSGATVTPNVSFNEQDPTFPSGMDLPIEPGKTGNYTWAFSGNHLLTDVNVQVDGQEDLTISPTLHCSEPVSFHVKDASESAVTGTLTNNSSFVSQTVYTRVNTGDIRVETLEPGESRMVAMPFNAAVPDVKYAFVTIGTDDGYQGSYSVDLEHPPVPLPIPR